ncbi:MAG: hypothetical protein LBV23_02410 [Deltaproteobacteria bacterium]|nr:hypothetical protein [Deltaproteobacteria bacterium]
MAQLTRLVPPEGGRVYLACPNCSKKVRMPAVTCPFCRVNLRDSSFKKPQSKGFKRAVLVSVTIIGLAVISFMVNKFYYLAKNELPKSGRDIITSKDISPDAPKQAVSKPAADDSHFWLNPYREVRKASKAINRVNARDKAESQEIKAITGEGVSYVYRPDGSYLNSFTSPDKLIEQYEKAKIISQKEIEKYGKADK